MGKILALLCCLLSVIVLAADWNPNQDYLKQLTHSVPSILKNYHRETGRFGKEPWICQDQNLIFPLAVAWWFESDQNPNYHSQELLEVIIKAGDALIDAMDDQGQWIFRKKDNSTWGMIHMPWTYSRWIRAYTLTRDAFPPEARDRWDKALTLGYSHIAKQCKTKVVHNITCHHSMGLYEAGKLFGRQDWMETAAGAMARVVQAQDPEGFWQEHSGPVVSYNFVYIDALGCYYSMSKDATVLPALEKAARYHSAILFKDGTSASCLDERNAYSGARPFGSPGFATSAIGRGFLKQQYDLYTADHHTFGPDHTAAMLYHGISGEAILPSDLGKNGDWLSANRKLMRQSAGPWQYFVSAYTCKPTTNRWIMERQNMFDLFLDGQGVIVGGGNTRMQPLLSTFTFGDTSLLAMDNTSTNPQFLPDIPLKWISDEAEILANGTGKRLALTYGKNRCGVTAALTDDVATLEYRLESAPDAVCEAHLPILRRGASLRLEDGTILPLKEKLELTADQAQGCFTYHGVRYIMPEGSVLRWPVPIFDQYAKNGLAKLEKARLVLCIPLDNEHKAKRVTIMADPKYTVTGAIEYLAADLPATGSGDGPVKTISIEGDRLKFIGATQVGQTMTLTLDVPVEGNYELILKYLMAHSYGISQLSLDGKPVGAPYNGYSADIEYDYPVSYGRHLLARGAHTLTLTIIGRDPRATSNYQSIRAIYLKK